MAGEILIHALAILILSLLLYFGLPLFGIHLIYLVCLLIAAVLVWGGILILDHSDLS